MSNFHEAEYDGVVLKIPSWFIKMNNLEDAFKNFEQALLSANKSMYYPDHVRNIYELEHIADKTNIVVEAARLKKEAQERYDEHHRKLLSGEVHELCWVNRKDVISERIRFRDAYFGYDDMFTLHGVKAAFQKKFHSEITDWKSLVNFSKENLSMLSHDVKYANEDMLPCNIGLFQSGIGNLGISYERLYIKTEWRILKNNYRFRRERLLLLDDGCYAVDRGNNPLRLEGFVKQNMLLVKK